MGGGRERGGWEMGNGGVRGEGVRQFGEVIVGVAGGCWLFVGRCDVSAINWGEVRQSLCFKYSLGYAKGSTFIEECLYSSLFCAGE